MLQHCWFSWSQLSFIQLNHILQKKNVLLHLGYVGAASPCTSRLA
jgi:hypothetical protein